MSTVGIYNVCTLQDEHQYGAPPRITAAVLQQDGDTIMALHQYAPADEGDDGCPDVTAAMILTYGAWATLAEMWIRRHPDAAQRLATISQGWTPKEQKQ